MTYLKLPQQNVPSGNEENQRNFSQLQPDTFILLQVFQLARSKLVRNPLDQRFSTYATRITGGTRANDEWYAKKVNQKIILT